MSELQHRSQHVRVATRREEPKRGWPTNHDQPGKRADLTKRVRDTIQGRQLFSQGQSILVGVSGGMDSMVLLQTLYALAKPNGWKLKVAHLNHRLRERSSDADERLVRRACKELRLPVFVERADVRRLAKREKLSIEMAARKARHEFFARVAAKERISSIALAHHADDQVELFFIRLLRGSGGEGLAGMKWRAPLPIAKGVEIVRPLLGESKAALREDAVAHNIKFREDATNASLDILRNRIRHELLPLLRERYQPALNEVISRLMGIVGEEAELAKAMAEEWMRETVCFDNTRQNHGNAGLRTVRSPSSSPSRRESVQPPKKPSKPSLAGQSFSRLPIAVQRRCLQMQLLAEGVSPDFELIEHLRLKPESAICVEGPGTSARSLIRGLDGLVRWRTTGTTGTIKFNDRNRELSLLPNVKRGNIQPGDPDRGRRERRLNGPSDSAGKTTFEAVKLCWKVETKAGRELPKRRTGTEYFDADKVGSKVILRHWRRGDRFQPMGMGKSVKLQDLFVNQKVPQALRHTLLVAESEKGEIFWVEGLRISERFQLTKGTKRRLQWQWRRD